MRRTAATLAEHGHFADCPGEPCTCLGRCFEYPHGTLHCDDATRVSLPAAGVVVWDPPWDADLELDPPEHEFLLAFCDGKRQRQTIERFGPPDWIYAWDCGSTWSTGINRPLQRIKLCLLYGDMAHYNRDKGLWGPKPPARANPTATYSPLDGRRLADLFQCCRRYMPERQWHRHAKPYAWVSALIGCCDVDGLVLDPFAGGGTTALACENLGRPWHCVELDGGACERIRSRLAGGSTDTRQLSMFGDSP